MNMSLTHRFLSVLLEFKKHFFMKLNLFPVLAAVLIVIGTASAHAQEVFEGSQASRLYSTAQVVRTSKHSELPSYIQFKTGSELKTGEALNWVSKNFQLDPAFSFELKSQETDQIGGQHLRYQQTCNGHAIENAIWILHIKNDEVVSMNGL